MEGARKRREEERDGEREEKWEKEGGGVDERSNRKEKGESAGREEMGERVGGRKGRTIKRKVEEG